MAACRARSASTLPAARWPWRLAASHVGAARPSGLPDAVALFAQADREFYLHLARRLVRHRVEHLVQRGQQAQPVVAYEAVGLDAGLVLVEPQVRIEPGHPHVDERLAELVIGIGAPEGRLVPDAIRQFDHVDMVRRTLTSLANHPGIKWLPCRPPACHGPNLETGREHRRTTAAHPIPLAAICEHSCVCGAGRPERTHDERCN